MKRREFMKVTVVGLSGLVGLERLIKALSGQPASAIACGTQSASPQGCPTQFTCSGYSCKNDFSCGGNNINVSCDGIDPSGYNFSCENFQCENTFTCRDVECRQAAWGDFDCRNTFDCSKGTDDYAQFSCDGTDDIGGAQFNCHNRFRCNPDDHSGQEFWCEDFWCDTGDFECYGTFTCGTESLNYECVANFTCARPITCTQNPYHN